MKAAPHIGQRFNHPVHGDCKVVGLSITVGGGWAVYAKTKKRRTVYVVWEDAK